MSNWSVEPMSLQVPFEYMGHECGYVEDMWVDGYVTLYYTSELKIVIQFSGLYYRSMMYEMPGWFHLV